PGMGAAQKAVGGKEATPTASTTSRAKPPLPVANASASSSSGSLNTADAAKSLGNLPGTGAIPVIGKMSGAMTSSRGAIPGADNLVVLAALGSFAALGALHMLRRLGRI